jgi:hypothetical protein
MSSLALDEIDKAEYQADENIEDEIGKAVRRRLLGAARENLMGRGFRRQIFGMAMKVRVSSERNVEVLTIF